MNFNIEFLIGSSSFVDLIRRIEALSDIQRYDHDLLLELDKEIKALSENKEELQRNIVKNAQKELKKRQLEQIGAVLSENELNAFLSFATGKLECTDEELDSLHKAFCKISVSNRKALFYDADLLDADLKTVLMGRTTIGERVWDFSRLIDVLESDFADKVDLDNICCMGNSGGGTATIYIAALEDRIKLAMPSSAMCTYKDSIGAMKHCSCNYVPNIALFFEMSDLLAMACPKYYVQVSGKDDPSFPVDAATDVFNEGKKAYAVNNVEDRCTLVIGQAGHRFYADDAWPIVHKYLNK